MSSPTSESLLRATARKLLPAPVRRVLRHGLAVWRGQAGISVGCEVLPGEVDPALTKGWQDPSVAREQERAFAHVLSEMRAGRPRQDFSTLAEAVRLTQERDPLIVEVGCGSGWNYEVLRRLWGRPFRYAGLDYSCAMARLAVEQFPDVPFAVGEAERLPLLERCCDILISGTVLMHLLGHETAIKECHRVARRWCILHTVPVTRNRPTTLLRKLAYGVPVVEVLFNEEELLSLVWECHLRVAASLQSIPHEYLTEVVGEPITARTYVCEKT